MTDRVGILEWIDKTKPLKSIIEEQIGKSTLSFNLSYSMDLKIPL